MMPQVAQVVLDEEPQRHGRVRADAARDIERGVGDAPDRVRELAIVEDPEL
jgi:hypothetical protein